MENQVVFIVENFKNRFEIGWKGKKGRILTFRTAE